MSHLHKSINSCTQYIIRTSIVKKTSVFCHNYTCCCMVWPGNATGSVVRRQWRIRPSTGRGETLSEDRSDSTSRPSHSNFTDWRRRRRLHWSHDVAARSTVVNSSLDGVWFSEWLAGNPWRHPVICQRHRASCHRPPLHNAVSPWMKSKSERCNCKSTRYTVLILDRHRYTF